MKKRILWFVVIIILLGGCLYYYNSKMATTKVAMVAYPDFLLQKFENSNDNKWVDIESLPLDDLRKLKDYKFVLVRAHGIRISPEQLELIKSAQEYGTKVYMGSVTNPEFDITNIVGEELDYITKLMDNGCTQNYRSLFNYIRNEVDNKTFFNKPYDEPYILPSNFLYHLADDALFENVADYEKYYKKIGLYKEDAPRVAFLAGNINNQNSNPEHSTKLINNLEAQGLNVYPLHAYGKHRLDLLKEIKPDLVVMRPHGRLSMGDSEKTLKWLIETNIPIYAPLTVFEDYEKWNKDPQGMSGGMLSMSVVLPELDGAVMPYAIIAQFENKNGYKVFDVIPGRIEDFSEAVAKRIALKNKSNAEKKVAIYYFKGPGKNALNASGLEVIPSLYNTLKTLKSSGYNVDGLPDTKEEFEKVIMKQGAVLAPYALGAFDEYLKTGNPELVEKATYEDWCKRRMPEDLYKSVVDRYGEAPGKYMAVSREGKEYIAVTAVKFGNIRLLPQPMSAIGDDTEKIVHGVDMAPPHPYIASYLWTREKFKADAIIHFGTHGSMEFTPGKQVALSSHSWPDRLIGTTPHFYIYTISNIGEGIIAKRRSYTTLVTHLTPPFMKSGSHKELEMIHEKIDRYHIAPKNSPLRQQYAISAKRLAEKLNIHKAVKLDTAKNYVYTEKDIELLHGYLEEIEEEKVTSGIYTLGVSYPEHKLTETAELMAIDAIAFNLSKLDVERKRIKPAQAENANYVSHNYKPKALNIIRKSMSGKGLDRIVASVLTEQELHFAHRWEKQNADFDLLALMMSRPKSTKEDKLSVQKSQLPNLIVKLCEDEENRTYIEGLKSEMIFNKTSKMLDAAERAKAVKMADKMKKIAPEMYKAIHLATQEDMLKLLSLMQDSILYKETFRLLDDKDLAQKIKDEKKKSLMKKAKELENPERLKTLALAFSNDFTKEVMKKDKEGLQMMLKGLEDYQKSTKVFSYCVPEVSGQLLKLHEDSIAWNTTLTAAKVDLQKQIDILEKKEANYANAILEVERNIRSVHQYRENLAQSTKAEGDALINALGGGYTAPSSGGDPIVNPRAVPTGRNMYSIDAERTPSEEAWEVGKKLAKSLLESEYENKGHYPQKISFTLWSTNFISTEGATIAQILYLLGVEPVRDGFGNVRSLKLIPMEILKRPRIDIVVQTSGQLRDLASSRLALINSAVLMASEAQDNDSLNFVTKGIQDAEKYLLDRGFSPIEAKKFAGQRVFGGVNGNYGTGIMGMVENGDSWENEKEIAETYINNMGAIYNTNEDWGTFKAGIFEAALQNTETVVQPRSGNTWGALSLDHVYEFMGGLNLTVRYVTGNDPSAYFNDFRNVSNPRMQTLEQAIGVETNSTVFNPKFIKELLKGESSSLETFAETFRNTYGWNVMKPKAIDKYIWDNFYDIYVKDKYELDIQKTFEAKNPYAMQEMTAVMLETARKGYWKASKEQLETLAQLHAKLLKEHQAGCSGFVCDNAKLRDFIRERISPDDIKSYDQAIKEVREVKVDEQKENVVLKKEEKEKQKTQQSNQKEQERGKTLWFVIGFLLLVLGVFVVRKRNKK